jgi:hypothetical protein
MAVHSFVTELEVGVQTQPSSETVSDGRVFAMRWIPRLLAGTAVVVAAALTAAPVTAGLADLVLNPGDQPSKRGAQPALTSLRTPTAATTTRSEGAGSGADTVEGAGSGTDTVEGAGSGTDTVEGEVIDSGELPGADLVATTVDAAQSRVAELSADLQSGVDAGEFSQADADRVLADMAGYIHGDRTWPERRGA